MKILVFYRQKSDHARKVEEYLHDLVRMHDVKENNIKIIDPDTRNGSVDASLYDILSYPGIVVTDEYGKYIQGWSGSLPLMDELMGYAYTANPNAF